MSLLQLATFLVVAVTNSEDGYLNVETYKLDASQTTEALPPSIDKELDEALKKLKAGQPIKSGPTSIRIPSFILDATSSSIVDPETNLSVPDKETLLKFLREHPESPDVQSALWNLAHYAQLAPEEEALVLRYLYSPDANLFSAAVESLQYSTNTIVWAYFEQLLTSGDAFKAVRASSAMWKGRQDRRGWEQLRLRMRSADEPLESRRDMVGRVEPYMGLEGEWLALYVDLLSDRNQIVRWLAYHRLREETGQSFRYTSRVTSSTEINDWKAWSQKQTKWHSVKPRFQPVSGIGVQLSEQLVVERLFESMPAKEAGIRVGDRLLEIDGESTEGKPLADLIRFELTGRAGSKVSLTFDRGGRKVKYSLTRRELRFVP